MLAFSYSGNLFAQCAMDPSPDITLCHGDATSTIAFTGPTAGTTYSWTNDNTSIGLGASGVGNIPPFFALNGGPLAAVATIVVTPTDGATVCENDTFLITVNPIPDIEPIPDTTFCSGYTSEIIFSSTTPGVVFDWTNDNTDIGLGASGVGNISFTATNTGTTPISGLISPAATAAGCENRNNHDFTITINPSPILDAIPDQVVCANTMTTATSFSDQLVGTTYDWTNDTPGIGLAASGTGDIGAFTAINTTSDPIIATITVTPTGTNDCVGADSTFTITVNPIPLANSVPDEVLCANETTTAVAFTSLTAGTTFDWTNDTPSIGLGASGTGDIASFTALNTTANPIISTITVTPTANGCIGPDSTFTITVNPTPLTDFIPDQVLCASALTNAVTFTSLTAGTTFSWTNDTPSIGLAASGTGDIAAFTALNTTAVPICSNNYSYANSERMCWDLTAHLQSL